MYPGNWSTTAPDRPAIIDAQTGVATTYQELDDRSTQVAQYFRALGLGVGDHIALLMANSTEFLVICWAAQRSGLYYTPINWHLTVREMEYIVRDCEARLLIVGSELAEQAAELSGLIPKLELLTVGSVPGETSYEDVLRDMPTDRLPDETEGVDMVYTSGTSGLPKGGTRPLPGEDPASESPLYSMFFEPFGFDESTRYLNPGAPLYHAAALRFCLGAHRLGGTCVVMDKFDPVRALATIEAHAVTHSQWVPTMFVRLLRLPAEDRTRFDLTSHQVAIHAAAPCAPSVKREMLDWWGPKIYEYYGASEGGAFTFIGPEDWLAHPGSVGQARFGTLHILDDDGRELPPGETGTVFAEGTLPINYHNDSDKTAGAYSGEGWATVGDMGYLDEDGYLFLADRRENLIIAAGVNIYPQEIEDVLIRHPEVEDVAVLGVPNAEYGQEVKALVQPVDMGQAGPDLEAVLLEWCRSQLAPFKCPRSVEFDPELPRTPAGKLVKRKLMERYWT